VFNRQLTARDGETFQLTEERLQEIGHS